ncbi:MAG TPA: PAS-domain containing protein, partial [Gammaproteobacteria bacterium]|nr:PAS-domain containing protein [Gammaproteobacteria bacterium]
MSDGRWRFFMGPLVTASLGAAILLTDRVLVPVLSPAPGALMLFAALFAAYVGGLLSGLLSALLAIVVVAITLSEPGLLVAIPMGRLVRLGAYSAMLVAATTLLGYSQTRARRALRQVTAASRRLKISHVALNQVDYGVIVLDKDLRAQFMNRAVFKRAGLRERGPDEHPTYDEILRETAANAGYAVEPDKLDEFVAQRVAFVRSGNPTPIELRMAGGLVARFKCIARPDGGRMLTYTDVTDLTRQSDELRALRAALDQIDHGVILLDKDLRARYMNRTIHEKGGLRERAAGEYPDYTELLHEFATSGKIPVPPGRVQHYIDRSLEFVRAGSCNPVDIRMSGGAVFRFKSSVLPDGGRMLTFTDIADLTRRNDELGALRAALDEVEEGVVLLDRDMRTHFMNRAIRRIGGLRERAPGERPTFAEILDEVRADGAYAVPADQVDAYVAQRVEYVRSGNPNPVELRMADGKVLRFKCNVLPDGGRMLIYANVTDLVRNAEQLEKLATTDGMTGLHNRRQFMKLAEAEWSRFQRHGRPLSLLMLDVDYFKSINDRFGHDLGDQVIAHIAALCREDRRVSDIVARIGGEEYALLLPETPIEAAYAVAERLRRNVEVSALLSNSKGLAVTVSIGVAEAGPGMSGIVDLMKVSDR